ncbi:MAG: hypothetical protein CML45_02950 [Rhodobacteraceae bacterium]|nr:hypothetical protein [Paracoccaceae bacterium]
MSFINSPIYIYMEKEKNSSDTETLDEISDTIETNEEENTILSFNDEVPEAKPKPKKKERWAGLSPAKIAHLKKLQAKNKERYEAEKEVKEQLLKDAKEIVKARRTIKEANIKEDENKKLMERAKRSVNGRGRPKKVKEVSESEDNTTDASEFEVEPAPPVKAPKAQKARAPPKKKPPKKKPEPEPEPSSDSSLTSTSSEDTMEKKKREKRERKERKRSKPIDIPQQSLPQIQYPQAFSGFV